VSAWQPWPWCIVKSDVHAIEDIKASGTCVVLEGELRAPPEGATGQVVELHAMKVLHVVGLSVQVGNRDRQARVHMLVANATRTMQLACNLLVSTLEPIK
jgi:hypothetical protein